MAATKLVTKQATQYCSAQGFPAGTLRLQDLALGNIAHRFDLAKHHLIDRASRVALVNLGPDGRSDKAEQAGYYQNNGLHLRTSLPYVSLSHSTG